MPNILNRGLLLRKKRNLKLDSKIQLGHRSVAVRFTPALLCLMIAIAVATNFSATIDAATPDIQHNKISKISTAPRVDSHPVSASSFYWHDAARSRSIPVTVYYPSDCNAPCPVVIYSHGLGSSREAFRYLGSAWARKGLVAVLLQHPGSDDSVWRLKLRPIRWLREAYQRHRNGESRVQDIRFALQQISRLNQSDRFVTSVDMNNVGIAGNDLGALASLKITGQLTVGQSSQGVPDPRVKAIVAMSPPVTQGVSYQQQYKNIRVPCLFISGTKDDGRVGMTVAHQRRIPFDNIDSVKYLMTLNGADHMVYSGHIMPRHRRQDARYQATITRLTTAFWDAYLLRTPAALAQFESNDSRLSSSLVGSSEIGRFERGSRKLSDIPISGMLASREEATSSNPLRGSDPSVWSLRPSSMTGPQIIEQENTSMMLDSTTP